jgi:hypothetical protein
MYVLPRMAQNQKASRGIMIYYIRPGTTVDMLWYEVWCCNIIDWIDNLLCPKRGWFIEWYSKIWCDITFKYEAKDEAKNNG